MSYPYNQQPQLPPEVPSNLFVVGVPHRPPFVPQIPVRPAVQEFVAPMVGQLIYDLQRFANSSLAWKALFWRSSPNQYQNPFFIELLVSALEYLEYLMYVDRVHPNEALPRASIELTSMSAAAEATVNPGIMQHMDQEARNVSTNWIMHQQAMAGRIRGFLQQTAQVSSYGQPPQYGGGGYGPVNAHYARGAGAMQHPVASYGTPPANYGGYPPQQQQQYPQAGYATPAYNGQGASGAAYRANPTPGSGAWGSGGGVSDDPKLRSVSQFKVPQAFDDNEPVIPIRNTPETDKPKNKVVEEFFMDNNIPVEIDGDDAATYVLGCKSTEPLTPSTRGNYYTLYNPRKKVSYVRLGPDRINEVHEDRNPDVKYEDHETIHFFKPKSSLDVNRERDYKAAQKAFEDVLLKENISARLEAHKKFEASVTNGDGSPLLIDEPVELDDAIIGLIGGDVLIDLRAEVEQKELPIDLETTTVTFTHVGVDRIYLTGELATKVMELSNSRSHPVLRSRLIALHEHLPTRTWNQIHDRVTEHVNEYLKINMGMRISIASYIDDIEELISHMENKYGDLFGAKVIACAPIIASTSTAVVNQDSSIFKASFGVEDDQCHAAFVVMTDATYLPIFGADLVMNYSGEAGLLPQVGEFAHIHEAVKALFDQQGAAPCRYTKFILMDGNEVYAYKAAFGDGYLIRRGE